MREHFQQFEDAMMHECTIHGRGGFEAILTLPTVNTQRYNWPGLAEARASRGLVKIRSGKVRYVVAALRTPARS